MDLHYFVQLGRAGAREHVDFQDPAQFLPPEDKSYYIILMNAMTRISKIKVESTYQSSSDATEKSGILVYTLNILTWIDIVKNILI